MMPSIRSPGLGDVLLLIRHCSVTFVSAPSTPIIMPREFLFVDGLEVARKERRGMRRHVMLGKNAGKTVARRSRKHLQTTDASVPPRRQPLSSQRDSHCCGDDGHAQTLPGAISGLPSDDIDHVFLTLQCPVEVCLESRQIIHDCKQTILYHLERRN